MRSMNEDVTHRDILNRVGAVEERVVRVETIQKSHAELAQEVRDDVKEVKKAVTRMVGFGAGVAAAISVLWIALVAAWNWIRQGGNT